MRRTPQEIDKMRRAGKVVAEMLETTRNAIKPGVTTRDLDFVAREVLERRGARSNFLGYHGFPAVICTSPNNMIVHGIPGEYTLEEGDIISIDCGAIIEGYHGDAAYTAPVGEISKEAERLLEVTERSLWAGIDQLRDGNRLHDVGRAVQNVAEAAGYSVVRKYVGHAIGTAMHEEPQVPNYWPGTAGPRLKVGNVFAIEPMVNVGSIRHDRARRRLECRHSGRGPVRTLRAHDRGDRGRPRGADAGLSGYDVPASGRVAGGYAFVCRDPGRAWHLCDDPSQTDLLSGACRVGVEQVVGGSPAQTQRGRDRAGRNGCRAAPERDVPRRARERAQGARAQLGQDEDAPHPDPAGGPCPGRDNAVRPCERAHHISVQVTRRRAGRRGQALQDFAGTVYRRWAGAGRQRPSSGNGPATPVPSSGA